MSTIEEMDKNLHNILSMGKDYLPKMRKYEKTLLSKDKKQSCKPENQPHRNEKDKMGITDVTFHSKNK